MICSTVVKCHFNLETIRVIKNVKSFLYIYIYISIYIKCYKKSFSQGIIKNKVIEGKSNTLAAPYEPIRDGYNLGRIDFIGQKWKEIKIFWFDKCVS